MFLKASSFDMNYFETIKRSRPETAILNPGRFEIAPSTKLSFQDGENCSVSLVFGPFDRFSFQKMPFFRLFNYMAELLISSVKSGSISSCMSALSVK
jgi:hypothetical protein